jgi:hypothetical protein
MLQRQGGEVHQQEIKHGLMPDFRFFTSDPTCEENVMQSDTQVTPVSKKRLWAGRIVTAIPVLLLLFSGVMKMLKVPSVLQGFAAYGYPGHLIPIIGILEIACTVVYAVPRTSILGAILLAAYLGGATATNVRVGNPAFVATTILGVLVWAGLYLRDDRLHSLIPLRT